MTTKAIAPTLAETRPPMAQINSDAMIPGARDDRKPIIPNITKHQRKQSQETKHIANFDGSV